MRKFFKVQFTLILAVWYDGDYWFLNYIDVRPNAAIPLLRTTMAVPLNQAFVVKASLYDYDSLSNDDEIANGSAQFSVDILKSAQSSIRGEYGEISVRVSWFW